ncbi:MAG: restriction endonuclease subunit S [Bacteroidaceae bacterium]|nr:restriction endonuclease subunit S [Bacteroidaceae bacterium]
MEEWKEYKLGEVCKSIADGDHMPPPKSDKGIPFVTISNIVDKRLDFSNTHFVPQTYYDGLDDKRRPHIGDTIYSVVGTFGKPVYVKEEKPFVFQRHIAILRPDESKIVPQFLFYSLLSPQFYRKADVMAIGAVQRTISLTSLRNATIQLPPLDIQSKIVSILKSLDDKIEVNRKINENLEQQAQALFKSWFVDFEPFKNGEFVESELGMIPKGWRVCSADEVFEINIGKTPPRKEPEWFTKNTSDNIWVSIADMGSCGMFVSESSEYLTNEAINRFNILMVDEGSVLLSFKLTVGRVAIADTRLTTNEAIARFQLPRSYYREFLYLYLKQYKYGNLGSTSSIATAVNSKTIKGMKLITPPEEVISCFSKHTKPLFDKIKVLSQESRRLAELRDTLLPKLMSGELKVNEIA